MIRYLWLKFLPHKKCCTIKNIKGDEACKQTCLGSLLHISYFCDIHLRVKKKNSLAENR